MARVDSTSSKCSNFSDGAILDLKNLNGLIMTEKGHQYLGSNDINIHLEISYYDD
ncbi:MAG: hypothetical protein MHPSP_000532 [Paramarteilia canceri]